MKRFILLASLMLITPLAFPKPLMQSSALSLTDLLALSKNNDWHAQALKERAQQQHAAASVSGSLPDPVVSIGINNVPLDSPNLHSEGMSQVRIGVTQQFGVGQSLHFDEQALAATAQSTETSLEVRAKQRELTISKLWLNLVSVNESKAKVNALIQALTQLKQSLMANYETGQISQSALVSVDLEISHYQNQLTQLDAQYAELLGQLAAWVGESAFQPLAIAYPQWDANQSDSESWSQAAQRLSNHPEMRAQQQLLKGARLAIDSARSKYSPKWALTAGYGYRADDPQGNSRSDLVSLGVSFSVPLYASSKQDKGVVAAQSKAAAQEFATQDTLQSLVGRYLSAKQRVQLQQRKVREFRERILPTAQQKVALAVNDFQAHAGTFQNLVDAQEQLLLSQINSLNATNQYFSALADLRYFETDKD
ncbi:TolC family protein [Paraferrimonas haliotis]|uniref:Outer membrane protein TolC n=1 Tax=Paraferrimonas haliotis TaxID=2013866 RepID=A0AA37TTG4_9GAMM|nr:TolC family protein [Paraferrimonas haliotis]GLS84102.1 hypothetical protein GCM10007894_20790 [Paraferrimonas haliotis]